jgi:hypothetical protein
METIAVVGPTRPTAALNPALRALKNAEIRRRTRVVMD